jgi:hypothetical protein
LKRSSCCRRFIRTLAVTIAALIVMLAPLARAADPRVVLVVGRHDRASGQGASGAEARIRAELLAGGLDVIVLVEPDPADALTLQSATARTHSIAAISVSEQGELARAQIWLSAGPNREAGLSQVESGGEPDERDRLFALRVADFLYASLVELEPYRKRREQAAQAQAASGVPNDEVVPGPAKPPEVTSAPKSPPPPARPPEQVPPAEPAPFQPRGAVGLGGTFWAAWGTGEPGLVHAVAPTLTGGWWPTRRWRIGGILSGPAVGFIEGARGRAQVDQELLAAELLFTAHEGTGWMISAALSGGAYRIGTHGDANIPYEDASGVRLRPFGMVGAGGRVALQEKLWLVLRVDSALVTQPIVVSFAGEEQAHTAFPLLLGSVGFEVTW